MSKLLLIDGSSYLHRGYYAMPNLHTTAGEYTGAVYGLVSMLSRIIAAEKPQYAAVCFDKSRHTFRTDFYPEYKGTRKETPTELKSQFALAFEVLDAMGIYALELDNYEGDDLIGTLALQGEEQGLKVEIYSGDRDLLQLVSESTTVHIAGKSTDSTIYTPAQMQESYGFAPCRIIDLKALMGDSSDNIPGIMGVGEKTAHRLLAQFGDLESLLTNLEQIENVKLREKVRLGEEKARLSYRLATICRQAPVSLDTETMQVKPHKTAELAALYRRLEFRSLLRPLEKELSEQKQGTLFLITEPAQKKAKPQVKASNKLAPALMEDSPFEDEESTAEQVLPQAIAIENEGELAERLAKADKLALYIECRGSAIYGDIIHFGIADSEKCGYYTEFMGELDRSRLQAWKALLENTAIPKLCFNLKEALLALSANGIDLTAASYDAALAAYLLNSNKGDYPAAETLFPDAVLENNASFAAIAAARLFSVQKQQLENLKQTQMLDLYKKIEFPLIEVLYAMEKEGIRTDRNILEELAKELQDNAEQLTAEIYSLAGTEFNINSPKQLGEILFERLGIPGGKKTKTGYSTAADILEELAPYNKIIGKVLEYRTCSKLKSTYAEGLQKVINIHTGKLHTSYKQTVTATGRLSSAEPNLQNIPVRYEEGRLLRLAFLPSQPQNLLLAADYNQIELRVLAHISGDEKLIDAFRNNEDIHTRTAMEVLGLTLEHVTPELRRRAKAVNFGIVYGISDFGLAKDTGISRKEAHEYIEKYFERYPKVKLYQERTIAEAKECGYVKTLYGRRRYLPELRSSNFNVRSFAERMAINTTIQGSAADIMKIAMVQLYRRLQEQELKSKILLQVHDELILDMYPEEAERLQALLTQTMQNAAELAVPLLADMKCGKDWYSMQIIKS